MYEKFGYLMKIIKMRLVFERRITVAHPPIRNEEETGWYKIPKGNMNTE